MVGAFTHHGSIMQLVSDSLARICTNLTMVTTVRRSCPSVPFSTRWLSRAEGLYGTICLGSQGQFPTDLDGPESASTIRRMSFFK
jgi:hypothetical protein